MNPLDLLDHPPADAEPPPSGALTARVMARVREAAARPPAPASSGIPWGYPVAALLVLGLIALPLDVPDLEFGLDPWWFPELAAISLLAGLVLALPRRRA